MDYETQLKELEKKQQRAPIVFAVQCTGVVFLILFGLGIAGLLPGEYNVFDGLFSKSSDTFLATDERTPRSYSQQAQTETVSRTDTTQSNVSSKTIPTRISIPSINVDSNIEIPRSRNVDILDEHLKKGAVYYPGSGTIEQGNIFIFGHSTNWKIVQNKAFKVFNNLDKLNKGDMINLYENGKDYGYEVISVILVDSNQALVKLDHSSQTLTLSTCNSFGAKQERWVVQAKRVR